MPSTIKKCKCKHAYQDKHYGKNRRVFNKTLGNRKGIEGWRCTVCGQVVQS